MLVIGDVQLDQFSERQRDLSLKRIAETLSEQDPALCGGRGPEDMLPMVRKAAQFADSLGLSSIGAVAIVATVQLLLEADPTAREGLQPLIALMSDQTKPETERLERANTLLFDLEESMQPELRRDGLMITPTPELDV